MAPSFILHPRGDDSHATNLLVYQVVLSALIITLIGLLGLLCYLNWRYWTVHSQGVKAVALAQNLMTAVRRRDDKLDDIEARLMNSQRTYQTEHAASDGASMSSLRTHVDGQDLGGPFVLGDDSDVDVDVEDDEDEMTVVGTIRSVRVSIATPTKTEQHIPQRAVLVVDEGEDARVADDEGRSPTAGSGAGDFWTHPDLETEIDEPKGDVTKPAGRKLA